jgi:hypothetical protein
MEKMITHEIRHAAKVETEPAVAALKPVQSLRSATASTLSHPILPARLGIGGVNDRFEQEAGRIAGKAIRQPAASGVSPQVSSTAGACCQRETDGSIEEETGKLNARDATR